MVGKGLQGLLLPLPATKYAPRLPHGASTYIRTWEERIASLCQLRPVLLELGGDTPQPCHELQPPCQQSTINDGALWQLHLDPLTWDETTADSHAAR
jgi:hypothetical protein